MPKKVSETNTVLTSLILKSGRRNKNLKSKTLSLSFSLQ
jgi:hypothetical protein